MPDFEWEDKCRGIVCGIDEAGRGRRPVRWLPEPSLSKTAICILIC